MRSELQPLATWINSRHHPEQAMKHNTKLRINEEAWKEIIDLQEQADAALAIALFLGSILVVVLMIAYMMWVNYLIIH